MQPSATGSFLKFTMGFLVFISLSFGLTYAVNSYTTAQQQQQAAAAAMAGLTHLGQ
jgi:hypothetical protein